MKLILYDRLEDKVYSIQDSKYFEEQLDVEDLKEIYIEIRSFFYIQNILDNMIKNILKERMSSIEFNGFIDYVDDYLTKRKNMI